jgi:hypothetical protein
VFALAPMHGAIGHCGASNTNRLRDSRICKPLIEQGTHSSLERFAETNRMLAQVASALRNGADARRGVR